MTRLLTCLSCLLLTLSVMVGTTYAKSMEHEKDVVTLHVASEINAVMVATVNVGIESVYDFNFVVTDRFSEAAKLMAYHVDKGRVDSLREVMVLGYRTGKNLAFLDEYNDYNPEVDVDVLINRFSSINYIRTIDLADFAFSITEATVLFEEPVLYPAAYNYKQLGKVNSRKLSNIRQTQVIRTNC